MVFATALLIAAADPAAATIAEAKAAVTRDFADPAAAQFRETRAITTAMGLPIVCGEVNGKNRFGGYVGFRRFVWGGGDSTAVATPRTAIPPQLQPAWQACGWRVNDLGFDVQ